MRVKSKSKGAVEAFEEHVSLDVFLDDELRDLSSG
jgi:hypothetical protein